MCPQTRTHTHTHTQHRYAFFHSKGRSDPVEDKDISSSDMIVPFFTSHELHTGSAGLLVAAIVGCSLSVVGAGLNAASTCLVIDIMPILQRKKKEDQDLVLSLIHI